MKLKYVFETNKNFFNNHKQQNISSVSRMKKIPSYCHNFVKQNSYDLYGAKERPQKFDITNAFSIAHVSKLIFAFKSVLNIPDKKKQSSKQNNTMNFFKKS